MAIRSSKSKSTGIFPVFRDSYVICAFQKNLSGAFPPVKSASIPPLLRPTIAAGGGAAGYGSDPARNHRADSHTPVVLALVRLHRRRPSFYHHQEKTDSLKK